MRTILAKLNNIINVLEENGFVKEANKLDGLFDELALNQISGKPLPENIKSLQVNSDEDRLFNDMPAEMSGGGEFSPEATERMKKFPKPRGFDPSMNVDKEFGSPDELGTAEYADVLEEPMIKIKRVD